MALSKKSITGLSAFLSCAVIAVSGLLVVKPAYDQAQLNREELSTMQTDTAIKEARLKTLEEGVENYEEIQAYIDTFLKYAPAEKDIESASRAISTALTPGTRIVSFTFGTEEAAAKYPVPEASLDGQSGTESSGDTSASSGGDGETEVTAGTFQRMPIEVQVTSESYEALSEYVDNLAQQERLVTVLSVNSSGGGENGVTATIKGYVFIYSR